MSKKETSPGLETSNDEQTNNDSDSPVQRHDSVKRPTLALIVDTTLEDLPLELIESIFVRAIVMEVEEMHLAKSVWKEKAQLVISRLSEVGSDWRNILTTNFFQNELYRTLDRTVDKTTIRLEILLQSPVLGGVVEAISFKEELFLRCSANVANSCLIIVYDRNNMAEVKHFIVLPGLESRGMVACSVSNCLYVLNAKKEVQVPVVRISKAGEYLFYATPHISCDWNPSGFAVAASGSIILSKLCIRKGLARIRVYDASGSLQRKMTLSSDLYTCRFSKIIPKSDGNLILVSSDDRWRTKLTEIDMTGTVLRQYQSSQQGSWDAVCHAGPMGRIAIVSQLNRIQLFDSEFELLNDSSRQLDKGHLSTFGNIHYNSERNEMVAVLSDEKPVVCIFQFAEG